MKTPKPRRLPSGSWHIQLRLGGRSVSITEATEKACVQKAQLIKAEHIAGKDTRSMDRSLNTLDKLLAHYINAKKPVLSPSTVRGYEIIRSTRFQAYMDKNPEKINWQRLVSDESRLCGPKTLKNAWALVAAAVQFCGYEKPVATLPQVVSDEHPYLEAKQIPLFLDAVRGDACEIPALLALHSLRLSEVCGLTWGNVDLDAAVIHVHGAVVFDKDGNKVHKQTNKNKGSRRTIPIMIPRLLDLLNAVPEDQRTGCVVTCYPNSVYRSVSRITDRAGLPRVGVHGLRHTFASLAHSLGVPEAECMALGGWNDPQTMRKIYTHLDNDARLKAQNAIAGFYQNANANS